MMLIDARIGEGCGINKISVRADMEVRTAVCENGAQCPIMLTQKDITFW